MKKSFLAFLFWALLAHPISALCSTCGSNWPLLFPGRLDGTLADITILHSYKSPAGEDLVDVHVNNLYHGGVPSDPVVLLGSSGAFDLGPRLSGSPIGSRMILSFSFLPDSDVGNPYFCSEIVDVVNGSIEGYIRDYSCNTYNPYGRDCSYESESMTLEEFDEIQRNYFAGANQARLSERARNDELLPKYNFERGTLSLPYVQVYDTVEQRSTDQPPSRAVQSVLKLLEGGDGTLLFEILSHRDR